MAQGAAQAAAVHAESRIAQVLGGRGLLEARGLPLELPAQVPLCKQDRQLLMDSTMLIGLDLRIPCICDSMAVIWHITSSHHVAITQSCLCLCTAWFP